MHILSEMKDLDMVPQPGLAQRSTNDLNPATSDDDRQGLTEVTDKQHCDVTEQPLTIFQKVFKALINGFWTIAALHRSLIPYDELGLLKNLMDLVALCDIASRSFICRDGKFEA